MGFEAVTSSRAESVELPRASGLHQSLPSSSQTQARGNSDADTITKGRQPSGLIGGESPNDETATPKSEKPGGDGDTGNVRPEASQTKNVETPGDGENNHDKQGANASKAPQQDTPPTLEGAAPNVNGDKGGSGGGSTGPDGSGGSGGHSGSNVSAGPPGPPGEPGSPGEPGKGEKGPQGDPGSKKAGVWSGIIAGTATGLAGIGELAMYQNSANKAQDKKLAILANQIQQSQQQ